MEAKNIFAKLGVEYCISDGPHKGHYRKPPGKLSEDGSKIIIDSEEYDRIGVQWGTYYYKHSK